MTLDQFRTKWGGVFGSLLICELINRVDASVNPPLVAAGKELADDLKNLLAAVNPVEQTPDAAHRRLFPIRNDEKGSER